MIEIIIVIRVMMLNIIAIKDRYIDAFLRRVWMLLLLLLLIDIKKGDCAILAGSCPIIVVI